MINVCLVPVFGGGKIDSGDVYLILTCLDVLVELFLPSRIDSNLMREFGAFVSTNDL